MRGIRVAAAVIGLSVLCAGHAGAQEREPAREPERAASRLIEEVVVTAQKREENLQDVPISVQAFSAELLDARGVADAKDLPAITPGLTITSEAGFAITYLRGVGSDAFVMGDPSVATYIDGVYFPFQHGLAQDFGALERIEVLKGPQGTLFGRNAVGGAINIITRQPDFSGTDTSIQTSYGRFDELRTRIHSNVPLTDTIAFSVSAVYNNADNYMEGTAAGRPLPAETARAARLKLRWKPAENLDFNLAAFRLQQQGLSTLFALNAEPRPIAELALVQPQTGYSGAVDNPSYFHMQNTVIYGQGVWEAGAVDVKLIGSDQYIETNASYDFDGSPMPLVAFEPAKQTGDVRTAELQLLSNDQTWGADWLNWIGGLYFFKSRQGYDELYLHVLSIDLDGGTAGAISLPPALVNALRGVLDPVGLAVPTGNIDLEGVVGTRSYAAFAQGTAALSERFSLTLGGRYQVEKRWVIASNSNATLSSGESINIFDFDDAGLSDTVRSFKPKVSLDFRPGDDTLVYLSWQQALKSAAYNTVNIYDGVDYVEPEEMEAYELGVKTTLLGGTARLNAAAFHYEIKNQQVQYVSLLAGGAIRFENAAGERIRGVDFDLLVELLPEWVDGLVLTAGGAYLDASYQNYQGASGFDSSTGVLTNNNDFSGNRVVRAPDFTGQLGLSKSTPWGAGVFELSGSVYHNSGYSYAPIDDDISNQGAYTTVDAHLSYLYEPWRLRATVFGRNLTDEFYIIGLFNTDFGRLQSPAPPRVVGLRLNWDF